MFGDSEGALFAASALRKVLRYRPTEAALENAPLFRDHRTGQEITYADAYGLLKDKLTEAGFRDFALGAPAARRPMRAQREEA